MPNELDENPILEAKSLLSMLDFNFDQLIVVPDTGSTLDYQFDIDANEFINFAEKDITQDDIHGLVNALSNSKRAIDCQVDKVLGCFGLISRRRNFPKKMEILQDLGIVAPRIVNKVVKARNYLEHEYKAPEVEQVEDAVDIAVLFVASLDRVLHFFPEHYEIGVIAEKGVNRGWLKMGKWLSVGFDYRNGRYILTGYVVDENDQSEEVSVSKIGHVIISHRDNIYLKLIKLSTLIEKDIEPEKHAIDLISEIIEN